MAETLMEGLLPAHGKIPCARCFPNETASWGRSILKRDGWQIENNPLAWGGSDPVVMVLGFSKGERQCEVIRQGGALDDIPFAGMRGNLTAILCKIGLIGAQQTIDEIISSHDPDFHFGSLVRCSLAKFVPNGQPIKSGNVIGSASEPASRKFVLDCGERFLKRLPPRLRTVAFLGNSGSWIEFCFETVKRLHPDTKKLNAVAYRSGFVTWIHVVHPSGAGISHIKAWLEERGTQGIKSRMATDAVSSQP